MTETALVPEPIDCDAVLAEVDNVLLVPHSKYAVVDKPFGLTLPLMVAAFDEEVEAPVETVGALCGGEAVTVFRDTEAVLLEVFAATTSILPSPSKSPRATLCG